MVVTQPVAARAHRPVPLGLPPTPVKVAILVLLYAAVLALAILAMRKMLAIPGYGPAAALIVNALIALLWAPTSWPYHWVWVVPALMVMTAAALQHRDVTLGLITAFTAAVFYVNPPWLMEFYDGRERHWDIAHYLTDDAYPLLALAALVILAALRTHAPPLRLARHHTAEGPETIPA